MIYYYFINIVTGIIFRSSSSSIINNVEMT